MIKIEKKIDEKMFEMFRRLFELYKKGVGVGKYYKFLPEDIFSERIDFGSRDSAENIEEGLSNLGKVIYFSAAGIWEYNDPSIKIDGYPPIGSDFWPVLEILLSKKETPSIERIEVEIARINASSKTENEGSEKETNKAHKNGLEDILLNLGCNVTIVRLDSKNPNMHIKAGDMVVVAPERCKILVVCEDGGVKIRIEKPSRIYFQYLLKEFGYRIISACREKEVYLRRIEPGQENSVKKNVEKFLDEIIDFAKLNARELRFDGSMGLILWVLNTDKSLVRIIPNDPAGIALFERGGFVDKKEAIELKNNMPIGMSRAYYSIDGFVYGMKGLKKELEGKNVVSVLDKSGNWYLRIC